MYSPSTYDHYRPIDADYREGTYRVVGTTNEAVTLLRVGNAEGQRANTGEVITVSVDEFDRFEPAENPDGNRPLGATVASALEMSYWSLRVLIEQSISHPFPAMIAVAFVLIGSFGEHLIPVPEVVQGVLIVIGGLGLAYVGSGRL
ncbi:hypothetical protein [Halomarina pelagica]|uniref:hypothetical protein n=1 Tax=Halomarina pelagica TaxID=2961599 RepID=UPI0020C433FC|nr:hypothetical protein [Halomarina sp. BND7]